MTRVHLIISGDVIGVGYRAWVARYVKNKNIFGWVKNRQDRTVEIVAEGEKAELDDLIAACRRGPEVAWVKNIDCSWAASTGEFLNFEVIL